MLKKNKGLLIITSIVTLLPALLGLIFYDLLPDTLNVHWGLDGNPDGQMKKSLIFFLLPCILLALQWICILITVKDPGNQGGNEKMLRLSLWIVPLLSLLAHGVIYFSSLGHADRVISLFPALMGALFVVIGNYLPKTKRNRTMGIKIKWTLASEENWYATHRLAGRLWVLGGLLMVLSVLLPEEAMMPALLGITGVMVIIPVAYSWRYYKRQIGEGKNFDHQPDPLSKKAKIASVAALAVLVIFLAVIMFSGSTEIAYQEDSFTLSATYWQPLTVAYDRIDTVEYHENWQPGSKVSGFNSARLLLGAFRNEEAGDYTSYCYRNAGCVLLCVEGRYLAVSGQDQAATRAIYDALILKTGK